MAHKEDSTKPWIVNAVPIEFRCLRPFSDLMKRYHVIQWEEYLKNEEEYAEKIKVVLIMNINVTNEKHLSKMTNLKIFQIWGIGTDHIDIPLLRKFKVKIGNTPGATADACADFAMTLLLATARKLTESIAEARKIHSETGFDFERVTALFGKGVSGSRLGIFGMGRIGFQVARRAKGFGMNIFYCNRVQRSQRDEEEVKATYCSNLDTLLTQIDFLVLTAPLTPKTRHAMNRETFKLMKPDSIIINIGRGGLINQDHLVEALRNGTIGGAALDVTDPEPLPSDHVLRTMPNVIITPHVSSCATDALEAMTQIAVDNIDAAIEGRELVAEVL